MSLEVKVCLSVWEKTLFPSLFKRDMVADKMGFSKQNRDAHLIRQTLTNSVFASSSCVPWRDCFASEDSAAAGAAPYRAGRVCRPFVCVTLRQTPFLCFHITTTLNLLKFDDVFIVGSS